MTRNNSVAHWAVHKRINRQKELDSMIARSRLANVKQNCNSRNRKERPRKCNDPEDANVSSFDMNVNMSADKNADMRTMDYTMSKIVDDNTSVSCDVIPLEDGERTLSENMKSMVHNIADDKKSLSYYDKTSLSYDEDREKHEPCCEGSLESIPSTNIVCWDIVYWCVVYEAMFMGFLWKAMLMGNQMSTILELENVVLNTIVSWVGTVLNMMVGGVKSVGGLKKFLWNGGASISDRKNYLEARTIEGRGDELSGEGVRRGVWVCLWKNKGITLLMFMACMGTAVVSVLGVTTSKKGFLVPRSTTAEDKVIEQETGRETRAHHNAMDSYIPTLVRNMLSPFYAFLSSSPAYDSGLPSTAANSSMSSVLQASPAEVETQRNHNYNPMSENTLFLKIHKTLDPYIRKLQQTPRSESVQPPTILFVDAPNIARYFGKSNEEKPVDGPSEFKLLNNVVLAAETQFLYENVDRGAGEHDIQLFIFLVYGRNTKFGDALEKGGGQMTRGPGWNYMDDVKDKKTTIIPLVYEPTVQEKGSAMTNKLSYSPVDSVLLHLALRSIQKFSGQYGVQVAVFANDKYRKEPYADQVLPTDKNSKKANSKNAERWVFSFDTSVLTPDTKPTIRIPKEVDSTMVKGMKPEQQEDETMLNAVDVSEKARTAYGHTLISNVVQDMKTLKCNLASLGKGDEVEGDSIAIPMAAERGQNHGAAEVEQDSSHEKLQEYFFSEIRYISRELGSLLQISNDEGIEEVEQAAVSYSWSSSQTADLLNLWFRLNAMVENYDSQKEIGGDEVVFTENIWTDFKASVEKISSDLHELGKKEDDAEKGPATPDTTTPHDSEEERGAEVGKPEGEHSSGSEDYDKAGRAAAQKYAKKNSKQDKQSLEAKKSAKETTSSVSKTKHNPLEARERKEDAENQKKEKLEEAMEREDSATKEQRKKEAEAARQLAEKARKSDERIEAENKKREEARKAAEEAQKLELANQKADSQAQKEARVAQDADPIMAEVRRRLAERAMQKAARDKRKENRLETARHVHFETMKKLVKDVKNAKQELDGIQVEAGASDGMSRLRGFRTKFCETMEVVRFEFSIQSWGCPTHRQDMQKLLLQIDAIEELLEPDERQEEDVREKKKKESDESFSKSLQNKSDFVKSFQSVEKKMWKYVLNFFLEANDLNLKRYKANVEHKHTGGDQDVTDYQLDREVQQVTKAMGGKAKLKQKVMTIQEEGTKLKNAFADLKLPKTWGETFKKWKTKDQAEKQKKMNQKQKMMEEALTALRGGGARDHEERNKKIENAIELAILSLEKWGNYAEGQNYPILFEVIAPLEVLKDESSITDSDIQNKALDTLSEDTWKVLFEYYKLFFEWKAIEAGPEVAKAKVAMCMLNAEAKLDGDVVNMLDTFFEKLEGLGEKFSEIIKSSDYNKKLQAVVKRMTSEMTFIG